MGRFLLLIIVIASATTASTVLRNRSNQLETQDRQSATHGKALAREAADAAHTAVLTAMLRGGQLNDDLPLHRTFKIDGRDVEIESFSTVGDTVTFTVVGYYGGTQHRVTSSYLVNNVDFPGPLWVDAPYAVADVDNNAVIEGLDDIGNARALYLDMSKLYSYRLDGILDPGRLVSNLESELDLPFGTRSDLQARRDMQAVLDMYGTPTLTELYGDALAAFNTQDNVFEGGLKLASDLTFGVRGSSSFIDARMVRVVGNLGVSSGHTLEGNGVLLVEGNLIVEGTLRWDGLVYVRSFEQELGVDFSNGSVQIRGSLVVEQEAPPPGGHMDITIYRDLTGQWVTPSGEIDMYTNSWTRHTHRSERFIPDRRVVLLDRAAGNPHEARTKLSETLATLNGTDRIFFEFDNTAFSGLANVDLAAQDTLRTSSVEGGFGRFAASPVLEHRTRTFRVSEVDQLIVDIQSLRLLKQHFDDEPTADPEADCNWNTYPWRSGCIPLNWPFNTKWLYDRGGALRLKLYKEQGASDQLLYEAVFYWHRRGAWDTAERDAEIAADEQWRDDIESGQGYGTQLDFGPDVQIDFDQERLLPAMRRLGYSSDNLRHLTSAARHYDSSALPDGVPTGRQTLCHMGRTIIATGQVAISAHLAHGDTLGACAGDSSGQGGGNGQGKGRP